MAPKGNQHRGHRARAKAGSDNTPEMCRSAGQALHADVKVDVMITEEDAEKMAKSLSELNLPNDPAAKVKLLQSWTQKMVLNHLPKLMQASGADPNSFFKTTIKESWKYTEEGPRSYLWEQRPSTSDGRGMTDNCDFEFEYEAIRQQEEKRVNQKREAEGGKMKEMKEDIFANIANHSRILKDVGTQAAEGFEMNDTSELCGFLEMTRVKGMPTVEVNMQVQPTGGELSAYADRMLRDDDKKPKRDHKKN